MQWSQLKIIFLIERLKAFLYIEPLKQLFEVLITECIAMSAHEINILVTVSAISIAYLGAFFVYRRILK